MKKAYKSQSLYTDVIKETMEEERKNSYKLPQDDDDDDVVEVHSNYDGHSTESHTETQRKAILSKEQILTARKHKQIKIKKKKQNKYDSRNYYRYIKHRKNCGHD